MCPLTHPGSGYAPRVRAIRVLFGWFTGNVIWQYGPAGLALAAAAVTGQKAPVSNPWNYLLAVGIFLTVAWLAAIAVRIAIHRWPSLDHDRDELRLQKINLVRGELAVGKRVVERAIGVANVYEQVADLYWTAHRSDLAGIDAASAAYPLAKVAWDGFAQYNRAVEERTFISDDALAAIAVEAQRASDALGVAAVKATR